MTIIACIGAGNVGRAWSIVFARAGHTVRLFDADPDTVVSRALPALRRNAADLLEFGLVDDLSFLARIEAAHSLEAAVAGATYVQESAWENLEAKRALFAELDRLCSPDAVIASSTSAIQPSSFLGAVPGRARCLVAHPVNPPYLIPLVELCASEWTSPDAVDRCEALMRQCGQKPIRVRREIEGFILNRLQFALVGEALHLVGEGYCSVEDVDAVLTEGLARRWSFIGPFQVGHLNATAGYRGFMTGLGDMVRGVTRDLQVDYLWDAALIERVHAELAAKTPVEQVPERQAWRDRKLMQVAKLLQELRNDEPQGI